MRPYIKRYFEIGHRTIYLFCGWDSYSKWVLLRLAILSPDYGSVFDVLDLQIAKFNLCVGWSSPPTDHKS